MFYAAIFGDYPGKINAEYLSIQLSDAERTLFRETVMELMGE